MHVDLKDATLMFLAESAAYPELAGIAQSAHDALADGRDVPHTVLSDIIGKASEKGVLRAMHRKYTPPPGRPCSCRSAARSTARNPSRPAAPAQATPPRPPDLPNPPSLTPSPSGPASLTRLPSAPASLTRSPSAVVSVTRSPRPGQPDPLTPAWSFACMAVSPFVLAAFARYERNRSRRQADPLIDVRLFRQRPFTLGLGASLVFFTGIPSFFMILLLTLQEGLGYSPVKAGAVTLGFAVALAAGSARSAAVARRLGSRVLLLGCGLMIAGQLAVIGVMYWAGVGLHGWQLLLPMFIAGAGGGFFIAPVTGVVLAGISARDAGAASGALATAQQVGAALGIAVVGVIFFGFLGLNSGTSSASALPQLRQELVAAGVPASHQQQITADFQACFSARAHATDPAAEPPACAAAARQLAASTAPAQVKARVEAAVQGHALPAARLDDFTRSMRTTLWWQVAVFVIALGLSSRLPKVRLDAGGPMVGGA